MGFPGGLPSPESGPPQVFFLSPLGLAVPIFWDRAEPYKTNADVYGSLRGSPWPSRGAWWRSLWPLGPPRDLWGFHADRHAKTRFSLHIPRICVIFARFFRRRQAVIRFHIGNIKPVRKNRIRSRPFSADPNCSITYQRYSFAHF